MKYLLSLLFSFSIVLSAPLEALAFSYTVQRGDTLSALAARFDTSVQELATQNGITNPDRIFVGQTLEVGEDDLVGGSGGTYTPVTGYQSRLSTFLSASAATINVASTKDPSGQQIVLSDVSSSSSARIYLNIAPGTSKEEIVYCTGVTATTWTGCVRGLSFQGGSLAASTTLAFAHNAGYSIVISNVGQFYTEYVSRTGNQDVYDIKTFYSYPKFAATGTLPTLASQFATKEYVDGVGAGGFTASNVSTTRGLSVDGSSPERVGINASSTGGINFASDGTVQIDGSDNFNFTGNVTSSKLQVSATPYGELGATAKSYVDPLISTGSVTGTAGIALSLGDAVYISSTGTLFKTNSSVTTSTYAFIGFSAGSYASGATATIVTAGKTLCAFSGLSAGYNYYLNGTLGQVSSTGGTISAMVGKAMSSSCLAIFNPKFIRTGNTTIPAGVGTTFVETGFYPTYIQLIVTEAGSGAGNTISFGSDDNSSFQGPTSTSGGFRRNLTSAWETGIVGTPYSVAKLGTITGKSPNGFLLNQTFDSAGGSLLAKWTAWSE